MKDHSSIADIDVTGYLGDGIYSEVYRGERDGDVYAIKLQKLDGDAASADTDRQFMREAGTLARLDDPALPKVWEIGEHRGRKYLVMEFFDGETLEAVLAEKSLEERDVVAIGKRLASGLQTLHEAGLVHRDLKPSNVVWNDSVARLIDFGLVSESLRDDDRESDAQFVGTLTYSSPEQLRALDRPVGPHSDLYSLGALLYECMTGRPPFVADSTEELFQLHTTRSPTPTAEIAPEFSDDLADLVDDLLATDPDARPDSAADVRARLEQISPSESPVEQSRAPSRRARLYSTGHEETLEEIREHWRRYAQSRSGAICLVSAKSGDGGVHFSTLVRDTIAADARLVMERRGTRDRSIPFQATRELVESFLSPPEGRSDAIDRDGRLLELTDELGLSGISRGVVQTAVREGSTEPEGASLEAEQVYGELARLVARLAARHAPAAIFVGRLERLDAASRSVVAQLVELVDSQDVWLFATLDPDAPESNAFLERTELTLSHVPPTERRTSGASDLLYTTLGSLDETSTRRFINRYLDAELTDPSLAKRLHAISGGRPVVLEQLLDILIETGTLRPHWGDWKVDPERLATIDFPTESHEIMTARLQRLSEPVREVCTLGAISGSSFSISTVADVLGSPEPETTDLAETASRQGVLVRLDHDADEAVYSFVHDTVRDVLYDSLSADRRSRLHEQFAAVLDDETTWSFELARHYREAEDADPQRRLEVCRRAGETAAENFAYEEARGFLVAALTAAGASGRGLAPSGHMALGDSYTALERLDRAQHHYDLAGDTADDPLEKARSQLAKTRIAASRLDVPAIDRSVRESLELLDEPLPSSRLGLVVVAFYRFLKILFWRHVASPTLVEGRARRVRELRADAYQMLGLVGNFREAPTLGLMEVSGRLHATIPIGPSMALLRAYGSEIVANALAEFESRARTSLERARTLARDLGTPRATTFVDAMEVLQLDISGELIEAANTAESILNHRRDQIQHYVRSIVMLSLITNLGRRGYSTAVIDWFDEWRSMQTMNSDELPPSANYGTPMIHARLLGDDREAETYREASLRGAREDRPYLQKNHWIAVVMDEVLRDASREEIEEAIDSVRERGLAPNDIFYSRTGFVHLLYARRAILDETGDPEARRFFEESVDQLGEASESHPALRTHFQIGRAELARRGGEFGRAFARLGEAEALAQRHDIPWALFEIDRLRADWSDEDEKAPEERRYAAAALATAERLGWKPAAETLRERYGPLRQSRETSRTGSRSEATSSLSSESMSSRHVELQRQLDALLEVSRATNSVIEPDEVSRVVVDAAIRVLGAERGMLFLVADAPGEAGVEEAEPRVVRQSNATDSEPEGNFSATVLERVAASGEPVVVRSTVEGAALGAASVVTDQMRSIVAAPLRIDDEFVGIIYLDNHLAEGVFNRRDLDILQAMADHIPVALETARTAQLEVDIASERERRNYAERMREFAHEVNALMDPGEILDRLLEEFRDLVDFESAWAAPLEEGELALGTRLRRRDHRTTQQSPPPPSQPGTYLSEVLESGASRLISNVVDEDRRREPTIPSDAGSWLALPIGSGDELVGVAVVASSEPEGLELTSLEQLVVLAGQAGVAIEKTRLATIDPLTGLYNRRRFFELADAALERTRRHEQELTVLMLDFDDFETVNDRYGHAAGDAVLETMARRCKSALRNSDILGRYGGDEFAVVLPHLSVEDAARGVAERLHRRFRETPVAIDDETSIELSVSIGVAARRESDREIRTVLERADEAIYAAKHDGKNKTASYSDLSD